MDLEKEVDLLRGENVSLRKQLTMPHPVKRSAGFFFKMAVNFNIYMHIKKMFRVALFFKCQTVLRGFQCVLILYTCDECHFKIMYQCFSNEMC